MKQLLFGCMIVIMISAGCNNLPGGAAGGFPEFLAGSWTSNADLGRITPASGDDRNGTATAGYSDQADDCYIVGQPRYYDYNMNPGPAINQWNYDAWVDTGKPACWCCPHHGYGDVDGNGWINANDVSLINNARMGGVGTTPPLPPEHVRLDVNHDGYIASNDTSIVINRFMAGVGQLPNTCPDCQQSECYVVGQPRYYDVNMNPGPAITQANYDVWVAVGKPDCWCCPHQGLGDVNGDGWIGANDVALVNNAFMLGLVPPTPPQYVRCDVNHDGAVNANDVPQVWNTVKAAVGPLPNTCPDCP